VYEGGIRAPFFVRWPGVFAPRTIDRIAAHIDVMPTLLDICGVPKPTGVKVDGESLLPLLRDQGANWPDRTLFFQWHRGDAPELYRAFAARSQRYKLVQPTGNSDNRLPARSGFELYDMASDPLEQGNVAAAHTDIVSRMTAQYEAWFKDVTGERDYADRGIARISLGSPREKVVRLTRQDWRGPEAGWAPTSLGHWEVDVRREGVYEVTLRFAELRKPGVIGLAVGEQTLQKVDATGATTTTFGQLRLRRGAARLEGWVTEDDRRIGVVDVVVKHVR
jgi:hypothetical protein